MWEEIKSYGAAWNTPHNLSGMAFKSVVICLLACALSLALMKVFSVIYARLTHKHEAWSCVFSKALYWPLVGLIWFFYGIFLIKEGMQFWEGGIQAWVLEEIFKGGILVLGVWFLLRLLNFTCEHLLEDYEETESPKDLLMDFASILAIKRVGSILVFILAALLLLGMLNIPLSGLLAFGGISGAMVAFSAKDMLGNFFGGLLIYLDRHFSVGDLIACPGQNIEGTVEHIGWRLTRLRSSDKQPVYVPNSIFTSSVLVNTSRRTHQRIFQIIGVRHEDAEKLPSIFKKIQNMLASHPQIDQSCPKWVNFVNDRAFGTFAILFRVCAFSLTSDGEKFQKVQDDILLQCEKILREEAAEMAFHEPAALA